MNRRKPRQSCDGTREGFGWLWAAVRACQTFSMGASQPAFNRVRVALHGGRSARCHACAAPLPRTPGGPSRRATVAWKRQAWLQAAGPPPGWHGRLGAGRLAGSAFYCCCAAVPAEPSTAEYRWCLFNLAPPPRLSFNCFIPVPSNKLCALLKHCTSYRYCQSSSKFLVTCLKLLKEFIKREEVGNA